MMKQLEQTSHLFGSNAPFIEEQYENYLADPTSVSAEWRDYFDKLQAQVGAAARDVPHGPVIAAFEQMAKRGPVRTIVSGGGEDKQQVSVLQLINAYRFLGNRWANLDPLKRTERPQIAELEPSYYGFTEADLSKSFNVGSFHGFSTERAADVGEHGLQRRCNGLVLPLRLQQYGLRDGAVDAAAKSDAQVVLGDQRRRVEVRHGVGLLVDDLLAEQTTRF